MKRRLRPLRTQNQKGDNMTTKDFQRIIEREIEFHKQQVESHRRHLLRLQGLNVGLKAKLGLPPFDNAKETGE